MIYLLLIKNFSYMQFSSSTFLEKVSKKRHPSRIAPLSRSFGMTFSFNKTEATAKFRVSKVVNSLLLASALCHLRFFLFWLLFCRSTKKKKVTEENHTFKVKLENNYEYFL